MGIACPNEKWYDEDITDAYRIGRNQEGRPRILIVRLASFDLKLKLFSGRDRLREKGIKVSNELSEKQRSMLRRLKTDGNVGYFYKGELRVRQNKQDDDVNHDDVNQNNTNSVEYTNRRHTFRAALRRTVQTDDNSVMDTTEQVNVDNTQDAEYSR